MKVLISCLQVSDAGSKGHLHPALEIALALRRRGHEPILLPLPSRMGRADQIQVQTAGVRLAHAPSLPLGVLKTTSELARLAADPNRVHEAYRSFLLAPLEHQYKRVQALIKKLNVDVVVYDLLSWTPAIAARSLGIPEVGFCPGFKLVAPDHLQKLYRRVRAKLKPEIDYFFSRKGVSVEFHYLELLSRNAQLVFGLKTLLKTRLKIPRRTRIVGPLKPSPGRGDNSAPPPKIPAASFGVVCFGSVLDPADFPHVTDKIVRVARSLNLPLMISSRKLISYPGNFASRVTVFPYLPLPRILRQARVLFHHGGANTFSEAFFAGAAQILIPLTTDQPIQAELLRRSGAGFVFEQDFLSETDLCVALRRCLDPLDPIHRKIAQYARDFRCSHGAKAAVHLIEAIGRRRASG